MLASTSAAVHLVVQLLSPLSSEEASALLASCSLANQAGDCLEESDATAQNTLRASVEYSGPHRAVIEITDTNPGRSLYASRELNFEPNDGEDERARAIGLALGVLFTTLTQGSPSEPTAQDGRAPEASGPEEPIKAKLSKQPQPRSGIRPSDYSAGPPPRVLTLVEVAPGIEWSPSWGGAAPAVAFSGSGFLSRRVGGSLRGSFGSFPNRGDRPTLTHLDVTAGPLLLSRGRKSLAWIRVSGGVSWLEARLGEDSASVNAAARVSPLLTIDGALAFPVGNNLYLLLSPEVDLLPQPTSIYVDDDVTGSTGAVRWAAFVGIAWVLEDQKASGMQ